MALEGVLANIPGLAGYLASQQHDQRRALGGLQGLGQMLQMRQEMAEAPLRQQMRQAQLSSLLSQQEQQQQAQTMLADAVRQYGPRTETATEQTADDEMTGTPGQTVQRQVQRPLDMQGLGAAMLAIPGMTGAGSNLLATAESSQGRRDAQAQAAQSRLAELQMRLQDQALSREQRSQLQAQAEAARRDMLQMQLDSRRDMASLAASMRQPRADPLVQVEEDDGKGGKRIVYRPQSQAVGMPAPSNANRALKQLPVNAAGALLENNTNLRRAENALALIEGKEVNGVQGDTNATGWKGFLPDPILQRGDPAGIATRAAIADLGSLVIHDRSGAAVTAAEFPRLQPFIPSAKDDPETVKKKLTNFVNVYRTLVNEQADFYEASGYQVPRSALKSSAGGQIPQIKSDDEYAKLPSGAEFIDPNGVRRRKP